MAHLTSSGKTLTNSVVTRGEARAQGGRSVFQTLSRFDGSRLLATPQGMRDIGYVGNVPQASFEGLTPEVLRHIGRA